MRIYPLAVSTVTLCVDASFFASVRDGTSGMSLHNFSAASRTGLFTAGIRSHSVVSLGDNLVNHVNHLHVARTINEVIAFLRVDLSREF